MNTASTSITRQGITRGRVAFAALLVLCCAMAWNANAAKAAQGDPFAAEFNHVGLSVGITIADPLDSLVLTPDTLDPVTNLPLGALEMNGAYTDNAGNFTLPKVGGLNFPPISVDLDIVTIDGEISLAEPATGNYDAATGEMTVNPKISLTLGTDAMENLPEPANAFGTGPLACKFSPLDVSFSTENGWPHEGSRFTDTAGIKGGALAGAWTVKPKVETVEGPSSACGIIAGFLEPVGGLWLAQSDTTLTDMPVATSTRPPATPCPAGTTGEPGTPAADCKPPKLDPCPAGTTGTPPDCVKDEEPKTPFKVSKIVVSPKKGTVKAGKKIRLKVAVTNSGQTDGVATVALKSTNKKVTLPKSVKVSVAAGKTVTKVIVVKTNKKAKGKAVVIAKSGSVSGKSVLTVKKAPVKKKKRK